MRATLPNATEYLAGASITLFTDMTPDADRKICVTFGIKLPYVPGSESPAESGRVETGDIHVPVMNAPNADAALAAAYSTLLSFLSAAAEAYAHEMRNGSPSENADLFGPGVAEWAYLHSDEIDSAALDFEESADDSDEV